MDNFKTIYKILHFLECSLDCDEIDMNSISPKRLGISENRYVQLLKMLADRGYIEGVSFYEPIDGTLQMSISHLRITLLGLEYLEENSTMQKMKDLAKGIVQIAPIIS